MRALLLLAALAGAAQPPGRPIDLPEAYRLTLERSEQIAQREESIAQALARVDELKSAILPHFSLIGTQQFQESPNSGSSAVNNTSVPQLQLTGTQPLFSGFREFLAYKAGKILAESLTLDKTRARSLLYLDVAQAYLDLLRLQKELETRRLIIKATEDRLMQLDSWIPIGRSRASEALAARAQLALVEAQVEVTSGQEKVAQEALLFLTGLEGRLAPQDVAAPETASLETFLERARRRADVRARAADLDSAGLFTEVARRQRYPTIGLTGNYYLKRTGFLAKTRYDAVFGLNLPLFLGGQIAAQTRQAEAAQRAGAQALSLAERSAQYQVRAAFRDLEMNAAAAKALAKASDLAQANLKAQTEDYKHRLVTNLEVLGSINAVQETRLQLDSARLRAALSRAKLEVAAGGPEEAR